MLAVISLALCGSAEGCVGVVNEDEAFTGGGVVGVAVWVVGFGECVEGSVKGRG